MANITDHAEAAAATGDDESYRFSGIVWNTEAVNDQVPYVKLLAAMKYFPCDGAFHFMTKRFPRQSIGKNWNGPLT